MRSGAVALTLLPALGCGGEEPLPLTLEVWHGDHQRVGHLGDAQEDFNLMGRAGGRLTCAVGDGAPFELTIARGPFGFRRLGGEGHFNADIPIADLPPGDNSITLRATDGDAELVEVITVHRATGDAPLPFTARWSDARSPQDFGQCVDGRWELEQAGLRSRTPAYDRLFLLGNRGWRDYEVRTTITIHSVAAETAPFSGGNGVGFIARFQGHSVGGPEDFPNAQPIWGYHPFGAMCWLRWPKGEPGAAPVQQFYRGDRNEFADHGAVDFEPGRPLAALLRVETLPDAPDGAGTTRYALKVWPADGPEPAAWGFDVQQRSARAHRSGGLALVAHHVDVTFGDVIVTPLEADASSD